MIEKLAGFITRHPKTVIIVALLLLIPCAIGYFSTFVNYDILSYLPETLDSVQGEQVLDEVFHNAASSMVVVDNMPSKYTSELKEKISGIDGVSKVTWIDDILDIGIPESFLPDAIKQIFYSEDENCTMLLVQYSDKGASEKTMTAIKEIRSVMNNQCFLSGMSAIMADTKELADKEAPLYIAIAIILALVALSFTMESWILPFVLLASLCIAVVYNMGTNIFLGQISYITQCVAAILQLGVTMDYSVFLIDRYTEEKKKLGDKKEAMSVAIQQSFVSLAGSSLTTIFGFLALCFMRLTLGLDIGIVMAKGVLLGVLTVVIVLPAMVLLLDNAIEKTRHRSLLPNFSGLAKFVTKHKVVLSVLFVVLLIPAYYGQSNVPLYYNLGDSLPADLSSVVGLNKLKDEFNMSTTHFAIVDDNLSAKNMAAMEKEIRELDGVTSVLAYNDFIGTAIPNNIVPDELKEICMKGGYEIFMVNTSYSAATDEVNTQIEKMNSIVKSYDEKGMITGEGVMYKDLVDIGQHDFNVTSIISIIAIFILVAICFKSLTIPVLLIASIELAIFINEAIPFYAGNTISFISPIVISCVQLGATVDYAILLTTRYREELRINPNKTEAMRTAGAAAYRSITQSALVFFCATFGVYLTCNIDIIKSICSMLARGSIISMLVIFFILTPLLINFEGIINKTTLSWRKDKKVKAAPTVAVSEPEPVVEQTVYAQNTNPTYEVKTNDYLASPVDSICKRNVAKMQNETENNIEKGDNNHE